MWVCVVSRWSGLVECTRDCLSAGVSVEGAADVSICALAEPCSVEQKQSRRNRQRDD